MHLHVLLERVDLLGDFKGNRLVCACCGEPLHEGNIGGVFFDVSGRLGLVACRRVDCVDGAGKLVSVVPMSLAC